jgi:outer membrane protein OmpA-like peptidoglycan-associated protein
MNRVSVAVLLAGSMALSIGCSSKKYVRNEVTPIVNKTNELDDLTAKNSRDIKDVDARAQQGIQQVNAKTAEVDQKASAARQSADQAQQNATTAVNRVTSLENTVANLDNYRTVVETSVHFGFDKDNLSSKAKKALDQLASEIPNTKGYIITVEGGADAVGSENYNYGLSERRADSVIQYLASKHSVPAHKIYLIGLGKDKPVATNKTSKGRAENRRVDIRLMTNTQGNPAAGTSTSPSAALQNQQQSPQQ